MKRREKGQPSEAEYREIMASGAFTDEEREAVDLMRRQLTERGITREPLRTQLACEFADVLLAARGKL